MNIPYHLAKKFLNTYAKHLCFDKVNNADIWLHKGVVTIDLEPDKYITYEELHIIATEKLEMSIMEFDYFLGQNGIA